MKTFWVVEKRMGGKTATTLLNEEKICTNDLTNLNKTRLKFDLRQ